ncbi:MAG: hypothetical protein P0Y62_11545 [Candidatus Chryseobacterium colombiense]|nr:hypothetical protein [Chryseobacterium sp.]WEK68493.1 MAG: hypothetical protein P0Y62_11545 [Chryseobacterium sp.]
MEFNFIEKLPFLLALLIVIACYLAIRSFFKKIGNYTENSGKSADYLEEIKEELKVLNSKISSLEEQLNNKS